MIGVIDQCGRVEVSASRILHNMELFQRRVGKAKICATVKANAYGHGVDVVLPMLMRAGVEWACVYSLEEAFEVAALSPAMNVLVLAPFVGRMSDELATRIANSNIRLSVNDVMSLELIAAAIGGRGTIPVHVQVDTGLTRSGVSMAEAPALIQRALQLPRTKLEGIFSHLSHGEVPGHVTVARQAAALQDIAGPFKRKDRRLLVHLQNSGGAWQKVWASLETPLLDMVRIGIGVYGLQPSLAEPIDGLLPVARMVAPILMIHDVGAKVGAGYGHLFVTARPSRLAIVPVGYADGYPRAMTGKGIVQVRGTSAPVVGRVSMDQIIVDVTDVPAAAVGDEVVVISNDPAAPNGMDAIATATGTIGYEIATGLGRRLHRRMVE